MCLSVIVIIIIDIIIIIIIRHMLGLDRLITASSNDPFKVIPSRLLLGVNDDQQDATILAYLFIPNQLYMLRAMFSPIIRNT